MSSLSKFKRTAIFLLLGTLFWFLGSLSNADGNLDYQSRGNYNEGHRGKFAAYNIAIKSLHSWPLPMVPKECKKLNVAFYLEKIPDDGVRLNIFDHDESYYHLQKKFKPQDLKVGLNVFSWPATIYNSLNVKPQNLNFRLNLRGADADFGTDELLAPIIFSCGQVANTEMEQIELILDVGADAKLNVKVGENDEGDEGDVLRRVPGGVRTKYNLAKKIRNGDEKVKITISGYELSTNAPLVQRLYLYVPGSPKLKYQSEKAATK